MFAPPGTFDSESRLFDACNDSVDGHSTTALTINPATNLPMIDDAGIDVGGSPFGIDIHHTIDIVSANESSPMTDDCSYSPELFAHNSCESSTVDTGFTSTDWTSTTEF